MASYDKNLIKKSKAVRAKANKALKSADKVIKKANNVLGFKINDNTKTKK